MTITTTVLVNQLLYFNNLGKIQYRENICRIFINTGEIMTTMLSITQLDLLANKNSYLKRLRRSESQKKKGQWRHYDNCHSILEHFLVGLQVNGFAIHRSFKPILWILKQTGHGMWNLYEKIKWEKFWKSLGRCFILFAGLKKSVVQFVSCPNMLGRTQ